MVACWLAFATFSIYASDYNPGLLTQNLAVVAFIISIGADLLIDFASIAFTLNSISGEINVKHWDLIRMSMVNRQDIIVAKHAIAGIRTWRMMGVITIFRSISALMLILSLFIPYTSGHGLTITDILAAFENDFIQIALLMLTVITFFAIYLVEPNWRMAAQTAAGLAISARVHNPVFAALAALAYIVGIWIAQVIIFALCAWMTFNTLLGIATAPAAMCVVFFACVGTAVIVYSFYYWVRQWALDYALRHAFKND
ncbi:MAG: hypothetical protein U0694_11865 [Anaerolineae bacterium]